MAGFRQELLYEYDVNSYEQTKCAYQWIVNSMQKLNYSSLRVEADFNVGLGKIDCSCFSIEELTENCYGESEFHLISMHLSFYSSDERICGILCSGGKLSVNTTNKSLLEQIVQALKMSRVGECENEKEVNITYNGPVITNENNCVIINGNNEAPIVNGNNNTTKQKINGTNNTPKSNERFQSIIDNLTANWIWIFLLAIAALCISYLGLNR